MVNIQKTAQGGQKTQKSRQKTNWISLNKYHCIAIFMYACIYAGLQDDQLFLLVVDF